MSDLPQLQPFDTYNQKLAGHVHPSDWVNPEPDGRYNLVVIGAGTAGLVAAAGAAGLGAKVALIERELMGGDCLNVGCVPSKALIASSRIAATMRDGAGFGVVSEGGARVDFPAVMERMRRLRSDISPHDSFERFRSLGVDVFQGQGKFTGRDTIEVAGRELRFKKAVIATGARAAAPPIDGLDQVDYLTNETLFSLTELPKRLAVIGAGPIGCEMAQAFARFGSEVFLFENEGGVLPREDADASKIVASEMEKDGVKVLCCGKDLRLSQAGEGIRVVIDSNDHQIDETVDRVLVAVGRAPNVEGLALEAAGVEADRRGVRVDDRLRTTNHRIFAAGDICSPYQFTHAADFMARAVIQNALFMGRAKMCKLIIPWSTYTSPEVAHVGLYPHDAEAQGIEIDTYTQELSGVDRAILEGETNGFVKIHVKRGSDRIVGGTVVATNAGDLISEITLAMKNGVGLGSIGSTIHPYPTQAEAIRKLGDQFSRTRLTPFVSSLFKKWLGWTR
ncbi:MAG: mercuric reductase [Verrucomicrobiales bacterium]